MYAALKKDKATHAAFAAHAVEDVDDALGFLEFFATPLEGLDDLAVAEIAASLARALEGWVVRGVVSDATQGRLYRALYRAEPNAAAALARARLAGPFGRGLVAALRVLASTGRSADIPLLLAIADRHGAAHVDAFSAAAAICTAAR